MSAARLIAAWGSDRRVRLAGTVLLLAALCLLSFQLRVSLRFGREPYIFYGDAATGLPISDAYTWNIHSLNLVAGRGFGDYIKQFRSVNYIPPGHPLVMGLFYFFFGNNWIGAGWYVALLTSLVPVFAYLWARDMFGRGVGWITALLVAVYPTFIRFGFSLMSEPTVVFTTAIALWLGTRLVRRPTFRGAMLAGAVFGFCALVRPSGLAFLWGLVPWLFFARSVPVRRRAAVAATFATCALAVLGAWQVRNAIVHGRPAMLYSSISARHAWNAAHPKDAPYYYSRERWHESLWRDPHASELDMIRRLQDETKVFVRADRLRYFFGCLWRIHLVRMMESVLREPDNTVMWDWGGWTMSATLAVFLLGALGFLRAWRVRTRIEEGGATQEIPGFVWCGALGLGLALAVIGTGFYGASDRYRWPLEYALFPFVGLAIHSLLRMSRADLAGPLTLRLRLDAPPAWARKTGRALAAALVALLCVYGGGLVYRQVHPEQSAENARAVTVSEVTNAIGACGLAERFEQQESKWVSYDDVFAQQADHYGALTTLNGAVVAWWGRILYPRYYGGGRMRGAYLIVNPKAGDFGGARLECIVPGDAMYEGLKGIHDGDIVTVIARLDYVARDLARPDLVVFGVLPGRFELPR